MDILGIGFPELVFIFIIALMVFGPRRLPEIAGKAGKFVRDLRNMSQGFLAEWQREITAATRLEEIQEVRKELEETKQALRQSQTQITSETAQIGKSINSVARSAATDLKNSTTEPKISPPTDKAEIVPASSEPTSAAPPAEHVDEITPEMPQAETSADGAVKESSSEATEIVTETPVVEKNGTASQATPAPVTPSEVAE